MHHTIITALVALFNTPLIFSVPLTTTGPSKVGDPCGQSLGDCTGNLTCIPLSVNCTQYASEWDEGCPGTCQDIDLSKQRIYTLCGGWQLYDDCNERVESCIADPRNGDCGPSCDGPGICWPFKDACGRGFPTTCPDGMECFYGLWGRQEDGVCFPLRFGSNYYDKSRLEEVTRTDQDGWQGGEEEEP